LIYTFSYFSGEAEIGQESKSLQMWQNLALAFLAFNLMKSKQVLCGAMWAFILACCVSAVLTQTGLVVNEERIAALGGRTSALTWDENIYAFVMSLAFIVLVGLTYVRKERVKWPRFLSWPLAALLLFTAARTGSRGAALALAAGLIALIFKYGGVWMKLRNVLLVLACAAAALTFMMRSDLVRERWSDMDQVIAASGRMKIFQQSWGMFKEKPLLGWSPYTAEEELAERIRNPDASSAAAGLPIASTHNIVFQLLLELGIVGAIPYFLGVFCCVFTAWRSRKGVEDIVPFAVWMTIIVMQMSVPMFEGKLIWLFYGYALASGYRIHDNVYSRRYIMNGKP
jgi:O-antigen ligase